jgi:rubrerythrin
MSKEQIEEMTKDLLRAYAINKLYTEDVAEYLYNEGYRKQSEGEWVTSDIPQEKYVCSVCGGACWYYDYQGEVAKSRYCPNCGAKMKGGEE